MKLKIIGLFFFFASLSLNARDMEGFLNADEIALFYKQGYVLKRQCLSQKDMSDLSENTNAVIDLALDRIRSSEDLAFSNEDQMLYIDGSRVVYKRRQNQSISIARINGCGGIQPTLLSTLRSEKMVRTFFELLKTRDLEHLIAQIHPKLPGDGVAYARHRDIQFRKSFDPDWQDILGNGSYAICIIPIDPMSSENGGLWIDRNNYPEDLKEDEDRVWLQAEPGDLLFMHPYLYHGSGANTSQLTSRKTLLTGFCAFGANHKKYPGTLVNTRLTLEESGNITTSKATWNQELLTEAGSGH